jgi:hypothetical protein
MNLIKLAAVAAMVTCGLAEAHAAEPAEAKPERPSRPASQPAPEPASRTPYDSAFTDYRSFSAETAPKDWRKANDEVRETGGHVGLLKGTPAQMKGHGAHGAKQPTPAASGAHK